MALRKMRPASWTWPIEYGKLLNVEKQSWWTMELITVSLMRVGR